MDQFKNKLPHLPAKRSGRREHLHSHSILHQRSVITLGPAASWKIGPDPAIADRDFRNAYPTILAFLSSLQSQKSYHQSKYFSVSPRCHFVCSSTFAVSLLSLFSSFSHHLSHRLPYLEARRQLRHVLSPNPSYLSSIFLRWRPVQAPSSDCQSLHLLLC